MDKYLIISDLDGTLAGQDHQVSEFTKTVIRRLLDAGHLFYICTGRMLSLVANVAEEIDPRVSVIGSNGGIIQTANGFDKTLLENGDKESLFNIAKSLDLPVMFFTDMDIYYTHFVPPFFSELNSYHLKHQLKPEIKQVSHFDISLKKASIINAIVVGDEFDQPHEHLNPARIQLQLNPNITVSSSNATNLEIYSNLASKGNAVKTIMAMNDIPKERVICFGDGNNDLSMLKTAGVSVAMDNANADVKAVAAHSTLSNIENGVAHFLLNYFK